MICKIQLIQLNTVKTRYLILITFIICIFLVPELLQHKWGLHRGDSYPWWALTQSHTMLAFVLVTIWMVLFLFSQAVTMLKIYKNNLKCGLASGSKVTGIQYLFSIFWQFPFFCCSSHNFFETCCRHQIQNEGIFTKNKFS